MRGKVAAGAIGALAVAFGTAAPGAFAGTGHVNGAAAPASASINVSAPGYVTVNIDWAGFTPGKQVFVLTCTKPGPSDPTYTLAADCDFLSEAAFDPQPASSGSDVYDINVGDSTLVQHHAVCAPPGSTLPAGFTPISPCYVRITQNLETNEADAFYTAVNITGSIAPPTPEVPYSVLLPMSAVGLLGGAYLVHRKRLANATPALS